MCFFPPHCNPSPAGRRATHAHKRYDWLAIFCTTNGSPVLARERLQKFEQILGKKTKFSWTPCISLTTNTSLQCPKNAIVHLPVLQSPKGVPRSRNNKLAMLQTKEQSYAGLWKKWGRLGPAGFSCTRASSDKYDICMNYYI